MRKAYFARPITQFGTTGDIIDIAGITLAGFEVIDITSQEVQDKYDVLGMDIFRPMIEDADALFFRSFDDGLIGAGVAKEIHWAVCAKVPVFELPVEPTDRTLTVAETRARIR